MVNLLWDILDESRKKALLLLKPVSGDFYLAGGTALAIQLGHRDSVDFDFFTKNEFENNHLFEEIKEIFFASEVKKIQDEKWTLTILVGNLIKVSFFTHKYSLIKPLLVCDYVNLASLEDIGAMKLLAITTRSATKDYVDLFFILQKIQLADLLKFTAKKYPLLDENLILKSLVFFDDLVDEPIRYKNSNRIKFDLVKMFLTDTVKGYFKPGGISDVK